MRGQIRGADRIDRLQKIIFDLCASAPHVNSEDYGVQTMSERTSILVEPDVSARLEQLHGLYGRDHSLLDILDGLSSRLARARQLYGPGRSLPQVVNGLYEKLDELRQLYGSESIEEILDGIIDRKRRLNRLVELQSKMVLNAHELREFQVLKQQFKQYVADLARQIAQVRAIDAKNAITKNQPRS
jgi:hypothetical protein